MTWLEYNKKVSKTLKGPKPVPKESQAPLAVVPARQDEGNRSMRIGKTASMKSRDGCIIACWSVWISASWRNWMRK